MNDLGHWGHWVLGFAFGYWQGMQGSDFEGFVCMTIIL
jgi:hypothetical protein